MAEAIAFNLIYLKTNQGLGNALRLALENCTHKLVARMDSDDISAPYRFQKQLEVFRSTPSVDIVGGSITEFVGEPSNITGVRDVELTDTAIKADMKKRCAMNHAAVMFKKDAVQAAGGYQDWYYNEDYYLWIRMVEYGFQFANVPYPLVNVRTGADMSARRGGWKYFRSEQLLQKYMLEHNLIALPRYLYNTAIRFGGEYLAPNKLRQALYKIVRKDPAKAMKTIVTADDENNSYPPFSVAISVYGKDNAEWFDTALKSIIVKQTVKPSEVVLVVDGSVPDSIQAVIDKYTAICSRGGGVRLRVIKLSENKGLGNALKLAVEACSNELIARMDSDDIAVSTRFKLQLDKMLRADCDICGGQIEEFIGHEDNVVGKRIVPETDDALKLFMQKRCPFNHMTVMYKKSAVMDAGNYMDWFWNEDYYLWIRMALKNMKFANLSETLVCVRVGEDMYNRRGGMKYYKSEIGIQKLMFQKKLISFPTYVENCAKRTVVQLLLPNSIRGWVFRRFARE